jgi:hypothetical protein
MHNSLAKLTAQALAQTALDKSEAFIVVIPFKVLIVCRLLILQFKTSRTLLPLF